MNTEKNIVIVGSSNTDLFVKIKKIPKPGETVIGGEIYKSLGGKGANQAVAAARAGGNVTFICSLGDDNYAEYSIESFNKEGINTRYVKIDKEKASGLAIILVDEKGENSIAVASGANEKLLPGDIDFLSSIIMPGDVLLLQMEIPIATVSKAAQIGFERNARVILNPAPAQEFSNELYKYLSIITPNIHETEKLTGIEIKSEDDAVKSAKKLLGKGVETVIITRGKQGVLLATNNTVQIFPAYKVAPVDTTAAGDIFNGVLAACISKGMCLAEAVKYSNAAAAISITKLGSQNSAPTLVEINNFLEKENLTVEKENKTN